MSPTSDLHFQLVQKVAKLSFFMMVGLDALDRRKAVLRQTLAEERHDVPFADAGFGGEFCSLAVLDEVEVKFLLVMIPTALPPETMESALKSAFLQLPVRVDN